MHGRNVKVRAEFLVLHGLSAHADRSGLLHWVKGTGAAPSAVFVTHGDVLHPAVSPWSPASARMRAAHEAALAALEPEQRGKLESRLSATQHAAYAEQEPGENRQCQARA